MSFEDLPENWSALPLRDPTLAADVVDCCLGIADRECGAWVLLLCDRSDVLAQPVLVHDVPIRIGRTWAGDHLGPLFEMVRSVEGSLIIARGRDGWAHIDDDDRDWHDQIVAVARAHGTRMLGCFLATPGGIRRFPDPLVEATARAS